jgi:hypothetical protein
MTTYYIQSEEKEVLTINVENTDRLYETALHAVGYKLDKTIDDGNVHEYNIIDKKTDETVGSLMEYMYERACFEALSSLGFSCDDEIFTASEEPPKKEVEKEEEEEEEEIEKPTNILNFPLLGSHFGTNV